MANLWHESNDDGWIPTELHAAAVLSTEPNEFVDQVSLDSYRDHVLVFRHSASDQVAKWVLLAPRETLVRINNEPLECGLRVLTDRDAIRVSDRSTIYFSTEQLARIVQFPDSEYVCARCKLTISAGDAAVCCPQCGVWHHEIADEGRNCWSYNEQCTVCDQATDLDSTDFRWTPEGL